MAIYIQRVTHRIVKVLRKKNITTTILTTADVASLLRFGKQPVTHLTLLGFIKCLVNAEKYT